VTQPTYSVEYFDLGTEYTADDNSTVIKNVLLCGNESRNGYKIPPTAFENASKLYTGKPVFIDHAPDPKKPAIRSLRDMAGVITFARMRDGKP